jgi:hypothetical protein
VTRAVLAARVGTLAYSSNPGDDAVNKSTKTSPDKSNANGWEKPYGFPLLVHGHRLYANLKGRRVYFGYVTDPQAAVDRYMAEKDDILAGRKPRRANSGTVTCEDLCNLFMARNESQMDAHELTRRSYDDYHRVCLLVLDAFGKSRAVDDLRPDDFAALRAKLSKTNGPVSLANAITRIKVLFNYATKNDLVEGRIRYGGSFERPTKKTLRIAKANSPRRFFEAAEIHLLMAAASPQLRAMILLGINGGLGPSDCAQLQLRHRKPGSPDESRCGRKPSTRYGLSSTSDPWPTSRKTPTRFF